jgi:peptidylprolyl isomerase
MRDILISATVCVACLLLALASQLVSPTTVSAGTPPPATTTLAGTSLASAAPAVVAASFELDPDDPNPTLFAMAPDPDNTLAQASTLGGEMAAPKERVTDSGLRITDLKLGDGPEARSGQTVIVNYRGTLENGKEFDSSYGRGPFSFPLGAGRVIKGWDEGVAGMQVGGKRKLVIPPDLGYGQRGAGGVIPPNATLIFEVDLLEIRG